MTKDEALKLALEALERIVSTSLDRYSHEQVLTRPEHFINQTITVIKSALKVKDKPQIAFNAEVVGYVAPQRTWVGLTNDELTDLFYNENLGQMSAVGQAIELLKERNS